MTDKLKEQFQEWFKSIYGCEDENFELDKNGNYDGDIEDAFYIFQAAHFLGRTEGIAIGLQMAVDACEKSIDRHEEKGNFPQLHAIGHCVEAIKQLQPTDLVVLTKDEVERFNTLMKFYEVVTLTDLVNAQASHIESLQNKSPKWEPTNITPPRIG